MAKRKYRNREEWRALLEALLESELSATAVCHEQKTITYQRNKPKRKSLPKDLPREIIIHDID